MSTAAPLRTSAMIASFADPGQKHHPGPVRARPGRGGAGRRPDRRPDRRPRQVHRHAHLRQGVPAAVLPDGHGRAAAVRRRRGHGRDRAGAVRVDLLGVRRPPRLRLHLPRHRRARPERQHRRRPARPDHRIRAVASGHRGRRDLPRHPRPDHRRPLRLGRHRPGGAATGRQRRPHLSAAAARAGAHRARRIRLHLRTGQGQGAARRRRRGVRSPAG